MPALGDKYVCGLDVAVDDSFGVRRIQCVRNLNPQLQHFLKRERLAGNAMLQRLPVEKLHRNERLTVVLADFVDGANVGMVQGGRSLCLTVEAAQSL